MFGSEMEKLNSLKKPNAVNWSPFNYGGLCGMVVWAVMWVNILKDDDYSEYPWYAWAWLIGYQIFFFSFPWNLWNTFKQNGKWNNELYPDL